jgi:hypothetical protein
MVWPLVRVRQEPQKGEEQEKQKKSVQDAEGEEENVSRSLE